MGNQLAGRRMLVVGASSGIGRSIAEEALRRGGRVVVTARRQDRLEEVAAAGDGVAIASDVRDGAACRAVVKAAAAVLGSFDVIVYAAAAIPMVMMADQSADGWAELFATNATGAFLVFGAAVPFLADDAVFAYTASNGVGSPYHGRGAYIASKAALDEGIRALRIEHPDVRFTRFLLDAVAGTEAAVGDDPQLAGRLTAEWVRRGKLLDRYLHVGTVGPVLADLLATMLDSGARLDEIVVNGPGQPLALPFEMSDIAKATSGFRPDGE